MIIAVPVLRRTADSADFFDAAHEGKLLLCRCLACGTHRGPQEAVCPACFAAEHSAVAASGRATLVSWCVVHRPPLPVLEAPYVAGLVEVEEGPWLFTRVLTVRDEPLHAGDELEIFVASGADGGEPVVMSRSMACAHTSPAHRETEATT
jgi:uncharacterized OB-fold protein